MKNILKDNDFTLVLSGGGALGIAHLGVLSDLEVASIVPAEIVGTSMGGIIGACLAIGMCEADITEQIERFSSLSKWVALSFSGNAIVDNHKIEDIFKKLFGNRKMSDTKIPLKLIATNLLNGTKRVFDSSDDIEIKDAVLATMAIPGIFKEHIIDSVVYGDGFLCANLGIDEASFDTILAVDVLGKNAFGAEMPDNRFKTSNIMEMFEKSMRLLIYNQTQTHLKASLKNIYLIEPNTKKYKTYHFNKAKEIRAVGMGLL